MESIIDSPTMATLQRVNQLLSELRKEIEGFSDVPTQDKREHSKSNAILNMIELQLNEIDSKRHDIASGVKKVVEIYDYM